jgi:hypothetical protein
MPLPLYIVVDELRSRRGDVRTCGTHGAQSDQRNEQMMKARHASETTRSQGWSLRRARRRSYRRYVAHIFDRDIAARDDLVRFDCAHPAVEHVPEVAWRIIVSDAVGRERHLEDHAHPGSPRLFLLDIPMLETNQGFLNADLRRAESVRQRGSILASRPLATERAPDSSFVIRG